MHYREQNEIAELFAQIPIVLRSDGARDFVRFLDQAWKERLISLFAIPGTAIRCAEFCDDIAKLLKVIGDW
jgi:hypothetical protein